MSEENEYKNLKDYFQNLVRITTIFLGFISVIAAGFFVYDRQSLEKRVTSLETEYKEAIKNIKEKADFEIDLVKNEVDKKIRDEIDNEISIQLQRKNVNQIIDKQLNYLLDTKFSFELKEKIGTYLLENNESLNELTDISDAAIFMRVGNKKGYNDLMNFRENAKYSENRARAAELINRISKDYTDVLKKETDELLKKNCNCSGLNLKNPSIDELVKMINSEEALNKISIGIELLNRFHKTNFNSFEFDKINEWHKEVKKADNK